MSQQIPSVVPDIADTVRTNYVGFASFTVLIWDHIDTFTDEVELIWKSKRKGFFVYLFLFVCTLSFVGTINPTSHLEPLLHTARIRGQLIRCTRYVRYEGCTVAIAVEVVGLMMLLRINAIYPHQKWIIKGLGVILFGETLVNGWLISRGEPVVHNPMSGVHACSMVFDPAISGAASASAWIPLLYDTIIFGLTLYRTVPPIRKEEASYIVKRLLEDGLLYYSVIFSITFILTFMIVAAPPGTKNICAQMEQLVTVAMMSRITLNLKKAGKRLNSDTLSSPKSLLFDRRGKRRRRSSTSFYPSFVMSLSTSLSPAVIDQLAGSPLTFAPPLTPNTVIELSEPNYNNSLNVKLPDEPPKALSLASRVLQEV
ncbi:hypothetical protein BDN70DRAFT_936524 [Pholiota conissans]|uniref:DUF6533 domain-containing protein n=1 Tax=Pholiota conissans TaxID=109636 RepID=A0A9P5YRN1_9AGAR|nr:hypothetical protein BDN70DRAFT_936524 [Pholiota conissans]